MKFILFFVYWFFGFGLAMAACAGVGFVIGILIALINIGKKPGNWALMIFYVAAVFFCSLVFWGILWASGTIGDRTNHSMQYMLIGGAVFPGIFTLSMIPAFVKICIAQTSRPSDLV